MKSTASDPQFWVMLSTMAALIIHNIGAHFYFKKHLISIEFYLAEIDTVCIHQWFWGDSRFGKRMRRSFIAMIVMFPGRLKKQEIIPRYKIEKLPYRFRVWIIFFSLTELVLFAGLIGFAIARHA